MIEIEGVSFSREDRKIYDRIDLTMERGAVTAIMGPSGTGKTTLLNLIGGQLRPDEGSIRVDGVEVTQLRGADLFEFRKEIGMLFQSAALFSDLSVFENVAFPLREHTRLSDEIVREIVLLKLNAVGLRGASGLWPTQLSGGMARRVALARAVVLDPKLVMYDEPFTGQDPISKGVLARLMFQLRTGLGNTAVIVSHDVRQTARVADSVYILADGKVIAHGTPKELLRSRAPQVKQFMHGEPDGPVAFHYPAMPIADELLGHSPGEGASGIVRGGR